MVNFLDSVPLGSSAPGLLPCPASSLPAPPWLLQCQGQPSTLACSTEMLFYEALPPTAGPPPTGQAVSYRCCSCLHFTQPFSLPQAHVRTYHLYRTQRSSLITLWLIIRNLRFSPSKNPTPSSS